MQSRILMMVVGCALALSVGCGNRDAPPPPSAPGAVPGQPTATPTPIPTPTPAVGQATQLLIGGSQANYGVRPVNGGFMPDPMNVSIVSGATAENSVEIRTLGLGPGCTGVGTRQPDLIVNYTNAMSLLRFYFQPNQSGDTALVINGPNGQWSCNDDAVGLNPMVSFNNPQAGQYDIWVASYRAGTNIPGTLSITELPSNQPTR